MIGSFYIPQAQQQPNYPASPLITFSLARSLLRFAIGQDTLPKTGYLHMKTDDAPTRSLYFRGAIDTKKNASATGLVHQQMNVTRINREMSY